MLQLLKSEVTKILTLRSTYIIAGVLVLLAALAGFITAGLGMPGTTNVPASPTIFENAIHSVLSLCIGIIAIVTSFSIVNEYRHNTIAYTVTASPSRIKVFFAKVIVAAAYGLALGLVLSIVAVIAATITLAVNGHSVSGQELNFGSMFIHLGLYVLFYSLVGVALGFILRNIVILIVIIFALPIVENLSSLLLKENSQYLPFTSIGSISATGEAAASAGVVIVAIVYVLGLLGAGLFLFIKRDA